MKGKYIVITRSASAGAGWENYLKKQGAIVYSFPTIETAPAPITKRLRRVLARLGDFDWIIFTSAAGVYYLREALKKARIKMPPADKMARIAVIGEKTGEAVRTIGYRVAFTPSKSDGATLVRELKARAMRVLLLRADIASPALSKALKARGARVTDSAIYKTKPLRRPDPCFNKLLMKGAVDYLTFASPSAVVGFAARVKGDAMKVAHYIPAIALSPRIGKELKRAGFSAVHVAPEPTIEGVVKVVAGRKS